MDNPELNYISFVGQDTSINFDIQVMSESIISGDHRFDSRSAYQLQAAKTIFSNDKIKIGQGVKFFLDRAGELKLQNLALAYQSSISYTKSNIHQIGLGIEIFGGGYALRPGDYRYPGLPISQPPDFQFHVFERYFYDVNIGSHYVYNDNDKDIERFRLSVLVSNILRHGKSFSSDKLNDREKIDLDVQGIYTFTNNNVELSSGLEYVLKDGFSRMGILSQGVFQNVFKHIDAILGINIQLFRGQENMENNTFGFTSLKRTSLLVGVDFDYSSLYFTSDIDLTKLGSSGRIRQIELLYSYNL